MVWYHYEQREWGKRGRGKGLVNNVIPAWIHGCSPAIREKML